MLHCCMVLENMDQTPTRFSLKTISSFSPLTKNYCDIYSTMSKDEYYANRDARLNTVMADDSQARMLKSAWEQWNPENRPPSKIEQDKFRSWLLDTYGVRLTRNHLGYQLPFEIIDEKKYLLFTLKFK